MFQESSKPVAEVKPQSTLVSPTGQTLKKVRTFVLYLTVNTRQNEFL